MQRVLTWACMVIWQNSNSANIDFALAALKIHHFHLSFWLLQSSESIAYSLFGRTGSCWFDIQSRPIHGAWTQESYPVGSNDLLVLQARGFFWSGYVVFERKMIIWSHTVSMPWIVHSSLLHFGLFGWVVDGSFHIYWGRIYPSTSLPKWKGFWARIFLLILEQWSRLEEALPAALWLIQSGCLWSKVLPNNRVNCREIG